MKKVKILLVAIAIITLMNSCTENAVSPTAADLTLSASQVPSTVQSTLTTNFPTATNTTWAKVSPTVYQASFQASSKSIVASITAGGKLLYSHGLIDPSTLPSSITDYLDANYAGYVINKAGSKTDSSGLVKGYLVEFSFNNLIYEIRFDAVGAFLSLEVEDGSKECTEVAQADLPSAITDYLQANYNGYVFNHARANKSNGTLSGYGVAITYNNAKVRLLFDATGVFVSLDTKGDGKGHPKDSLKGGKGDKGKGGPSKGKPTPLAQTDLLSSISTYLSTNYAGYTFVGAVSFSNGTAIVGYGVKITYQGKTYELEFDAAGVFKKLH